MNFTKSKLILCLVFIAILISGYSQTTFIPNEVQMCGWDKSTKDLLQETPNALYEIDQFNNGGAARAFQNAKSDAEYIIPVVFHVLYTNDEDNISYAQIEDAIRILNEDFNAKNPDLDEVEDHFKPLIGRAKIRFVLAKIAPNGQCFEGVTRSLRTSNTDNNLVQMNELVQGNNIYNGPWPHFRYLNVIVVGKVEGAYVGMTNLPTGPAEVDLDFMRVNSIFILPQYVGSVGTSSYTKGRVLTHEVGHWLGLYHTWGAGNLGVCGDDYVNDTPPTKGASNCDVEIKTCNNEVDNVQNFMNYSFCFRHFTIGQTERMIAALNSDIGGRMRLWKEANLIATGVQVGNSICSGEIHTDTRVVCAGTNLKYKIVNCGQAISSYNWKFSGGIPSTSTAAQPTVIYTTPGVYSVRVSFTSGETTKEINFLEYVRVEDINSQSFSLPFSEGFVANAFPPERWNEVGSSSFLSFQRSNNVGYSPTAGNSVRINLGQNTTQRGAHEELELPPMDFTSLWDLKFSFDVAYRTRTERNSDRLEIYASPGCGQEFVRIYGKEGIHLRTEQPHVDNYNNPIKWRREELNLNQFADQSKVRIRIRAVSDGVNNLFLDNFSMNGVLSKPQADFNEQWQPMCATYPVTFTDNSILANNWEWNFGADATPSTAYGRGPHQVIFPTVGMRDVSLKINDNYEVTKAVAILNCHANVGEQIEPTYFIGPNPSSSIVSVASNDQIVSFQLMDMQGKLVKGNSYVNGAQFKMNIDDLNSGNYLLYIVGENSVYTGKVVKN